MKFTVSKQMLVVLILTIVACGRKETSYELNESEIFFNEQLSSLSVDGDECYVGTEDGCIYRLNIGSNNIDTIHADHDFDRIYRVVKENGGSRWWIGARNMGLYSCSYNGDSLFVENSYKMKVNGIEYSPYDISVEECGVYAGTSNGLYKVPDDEGSDSLVLLYPDANHRTWRPSRPLVVNCIEKYDGQYLVASSDDGLLRIDMQNDSVSVIGTNERVKNIILRGKDIYALFEGALKVFDIDGTLQKEYPLECSAEQYYYVPETGVNYFIAHDHMYLVQDRNLALPGEYKRVELRRETRPECRNIIANAPGINRSLLVTKNALFGIGHNLDIFNGVGEAHIVSVDGDYIYSLVGRRVFRTAVGECVCVPAAKHVFSIPAGYDVKHMTVVDGKIYFVGSDRNVYVVDAALGDSYYMNTISSLFAIKCVTILDKDVTAFGNGGYLCGVRDSIVTFGKETSGTKVMLYTDADHKSTIEDPYVTRFVQHSGKTWATTLNDGIYIGDESQMEFLAGSKRYRNIRDLAFAGGGDRPYVLTSHYVYTPQGDSIKAEGFYRLLAAADNSIYGIGEYGIRKFIFLPGGNSYEDYFTDIKFNPDAVAVVGGNVYAGSSCGMFVFDSLSPENPMYEGVVFEQAALENFMDYILYLAVILILCILAAVATRKYEKKRYSIEKLQRSKGDILERLYYLEGLSPCLNKCLIEKIRSNIHQVETLEISNNYKSQRMIKALRKRAESTREQVEIGARELLENQKKLLKKAGKGYAETLLRESGRSLSFAEAAVQIKRNQEWLEYSGGLAKELERMNSFCLSAALIDGVTKGLRAEVVKVKALMDTNEEKEAMEKLRVRMNEIASAESCKEVVSYIEKKASGCEDIVVEELELLKARAGKAKGNAKAMAEVLIDIRIAEDRIAMRASINAIGECIAEFYKSENDKRTNMDKLKSLSEYEVADISMASAKYDDACKKADEVLKSLCEEFEKFYAPVAERGVDSELFSLLGLSASNCRNQSNNARILALLLSGKKIENGHIHILIGIPHREENMRKERWVVEQNMKKNMEQVSAYAKAHPLSCAGFAVDYSAPGE